jgi:preprotein translocase subunit SecF
MLDIIGKRFWFLLISGVMVLLGIIALAVFGLKAGIEFSSGSLLTVGFEQRVELGEVKQAVADLGYGNAVIQGTGAGDFLIRLPELTDEAKAALEAGLTDKLGALEVKGFDLVSPMIAAETTHNAAIAVAVATVGMLLYISWAFHRMPNPLRWGTCAIISMVHDVVIVAGVFAVLGGLLGWQIDMMFITGILTVIGYSVNDTIVTFDRIRENLRKGISPDFALVVNHSLVEILTRSIITGLGVLFVLIALLLFVGASLQTLITVLLVGVYIGTYGSIGIAAPLLVVWEKKEWGRLLRPARASK